MKYVKIPLNGARRNPDKNPKTSLISVLEEYSKKPDSENYFVTFTEIEKVGVNPKSTFSTPLGVYSYPISYAYKLISQGREIPYAGDRPYASILEAKKSSNPLIVDKYTSSDFSKDIKKCENIYNEVKRKNKNFHRFLESAKTSSYRPDKDIFVLWNLTRLLARLSSKKKGGDNIVLWNKILRELGYDYVVDYKGLGVIHTNEPIQCVFLSKNSFNISRTVLNKNYGELPSDKEYFSQSWIHKYFSPRQDLEALKLVDEYNPYFLENIAGKNLLLHYYGDSVYLISGILNSDMQDVVVGRKLKSKKLSSINDIYKDNQYIKVYPKSNPLSLSIYDSTLWGGYYSECSINRTIIKGGLYSGCKISSSVSWENGSYLLMDFVFQNCKLSPKDLAYKLSVASTPEDMEDILTNSCEGYYPINESYSFLKENI